MNRNFFFALLLTLMAGCATTPRATIPRAVHFPADALITQRGVLNTFFGKQFTLNGYLAQSAAGGKRLILTENFGGVLADLLIKPDGTVHVMRPSAVFKPEWIQYLAADVQCIFGDEPRENCLGRMVAPKHFVIKRRWYELDLKIVEIKPGSQSPEMFDETKAEKP